MYFKDGLSIPPRLRDGRVAPRGRGRSRLEGREAVSLDTNNVRINTIQRHLGDRTRNQTRRQQQGERNTMLLMTSMEVVRREEGDNRRSSAGWWDRNDAQDLVVSSCSTA